ncbi:MAG: 50S ribosomal protein L21 [Coriobacteriales bacterium]|jgi:large subunit ribosomal protein L21|nr:50S ribosomal protein L21 [Coriobacteriales bacterium]
MYAIVATGGKQYKVLAGDTFEVEKLVANVGDIVELDVVFIANGSSITTDAGALATAKVFAEVVEHFKGEKALIFKFKKRKGYKRLRGHRQNLTRLLVKDISLTGTAPKATVKKAVKDGDKPAKKAPKAEKAAAVEVVEAVEAAAAPVEEKPTKKPAAKKTAPEGDKAPADKPAKKPAAKKAADKGEAVTEAKPAKKEKAVPASDDAEEKPVKKTTRKPAAKKAETAE